MRKRAIGTEFKTDGEGNVKIIQDDEAGYDLVFVPREQIPLMVAWLQEAYDTYSPRKTDNAQTRKTDG